MTIIRNIFAAFVFLALIGLSRLVVKGQEPPKPEVQVLITPYVLPCGQGSTLLGLLPCGPDAQQGIFVHLRSEDAGFDSYGITVRYRTAAGERKTVTKTAPREDGFTTAAFAIGRVKTPYLPDGVVVDGVDVVKQSAPTSVSVGEDYFAVINRDTTLGFGNPATWSGSMETILR